MSFDFTPNVNLSNVQASAKSCPGGGGNTGYFQRGQEEENQRSKNYPNDSFEKKDNVAAEVEEESFKTIILGIISDFFEWLKGLFHKQS